MQSQKTVRMVVVGLTLIAGLSLLSATVLASGATEAAPAWQLAATCVGGLASLLASTKATPDPEDAQPAQPNVVNVTNSPFSTEAPIDEGDLLQIDVDH